MSNTPFAYWHVTQTTTRAQGPAGRRSPPLGEAGTSSGASLRPPPLAPRDLRSTGCAQSLRPSPARQFPHPDSHTTQGPAGGRIRICPGTYKTDLVPSRQPTITGGSLAAAPSRTDVVCAPRTVSHIHLSRVRGLSHCRRLICTGSMLVVFQACAVRMSQQHTTRTAAPRPATIWFGLGTSNTPRPHTKCLEL